MIARVRGLIRLQDIEKLKENDRQQQPVRGTRREIDFQPVVRLYLPFSDCVWLLSEMESDEVAFGLCDLGLGFPELGSVWLPELEELSHCGVRVLQDVGWRATRTIGQYAEEARRAQRIIA